MNPSRVRILILSRRLTEEVGGPAVATVGFARGMARLGAAVTLLALEDRPGRWLIEPKQAQLDGIEVRRLPGTTFPAGLLQLARSADRSPLPTVVWVNGMWGPQSIVARLLKARRGYPYVLRPAGHLGHAALRYRRAKKRVYLSLVERRILERAAAIHCMSATEVDELPEGLKRLAFVVPTGVEVPSFEDRRPEEGILLGVLARIHPIKRQHLALDALEMLVPRHPGVRLELAGTAEDAAYRDSLERRVRDSPVLRDRVVFLGHVDSKRVPETVRRWSVALLMSEQENFGHAVITAAAVGTPTVVSPGVALGGELVTSGAGEIAEPAGAAVAAAVERLISANAPVGHLCRNFALGFSWDRCSDALLGHLAGLAPPRGDSSLV